MIKVSDSGTKTRILDAAEQAFADLGFEGASLRRIIAGARVNLAAVHYHFGSKEALIAAVFERRIGPLNRERLALLDAVEAKAPRGRLPIEPVVEALVGPALRLARDPSKGGQVVMRLFGRTIVEPTDYLQKLLAAQFGNVITRFYRAFQSALPELPKPVLLWRIHFVVGAMAHVMCDPGKLKLISRGLCDPNDTETAVKQLAAFLTAGLRASVPK